jgi:hypothetical protein
LWLSKVDCCRKQFIDPLWSPPAQILICHGVLFSAFKDDFQIGESTVKMGLERLTWGIVKCLAILDCYLRSHSRSDPRKIVALHKKVYGIDWWLGCLDVIMIHWAACPIVWKGQLKAKTAILPLYSK